MKLSGLLHIPISWLKKLYNETGILPCEVIYIEFDYCLIMFKIAKHTVPLSISRLFQLYSDIHNYNTRQAHHIHSFRGNNEFI